jgi:hypothetical protein
MSDSNFLEHTHSKADKAQTVTRPDSKGHVLPRQKRQAIVKAVSNGLYTIKLLTATGTETGPTLTGIRCIPEQNYSINSTVWAFRGVDNDPWHIEGFVDPDDLVLTGFFLQGYQDLGFAGTRS